MIIFKALLFLLAVSFSSEVIHTAQKDLSEEDSLSKIMSLSLEDVQFRSAIETSKTPRASFTHIPSIAKGHEEVYRRFLKGVLIYKPREGSDVYMPISSLMNPLEDTFDLSQCEDTWKYLIISTGYRKEKEESGNEDKLKIWIAPRFLIEKNLNTTAKHYQEIMSQHPPMSIVEDSCCMVRRWNDYLFCTVTSWYEDLGWKDDIYISERMEYIKGLSLYDHWAIRTGSPRRHKGAPSNFLLSFPPEESKFYSFFNRIGRS